MSSKDEDREVKKLERAIMTALDNCTLPTPYKRGIINSIESRLRLREQAERNADKLARLQTRKATTK